MTVKLHRKPRPSKTLAKTETKGNPLPRLFLILCLCLAGCTTTSPVSDPRAVWCEANEPIKLPAAAVALLSRAEKERLAAHNLKGISWCKWAP